MSRASRYACALLACLAATTRLAGAQEPAALDLPTAMSASEGATAVTSASDRLELARLALDTWSPLSGSIGANTGGATPLTGAGESSLTLDLSANLGFDLGWDGESGRDGAVLAVTQAEEDLAAARASALLEVVNRYAAAASAQRAVRLAGLGRDSAALSLAAARSRLAAGAANETDVGTAELDLKSAELDVQAAAGELEVALAQLSTAVGRDVTAVVEDRPEVPTLRALHVAQQVAARADVTAAMRAVDAATSALADARRASAPTLSASATLAATSGATTFQVGGGIDSSSLDPSLTARLSTGTGGPEGGDLSARLSASVGLTVPLGVSPADVQRSEVTLRQSQAQLEQTVTAAELEVESLSKRLALAAERAEVAEALVAMSASAAADAAERFALGLVAQTAALDAAAAHLRAVDQAASAAYERLTLTIQLATALALDPMEVLQ